MNIGSFQIRRVSDIAGLVAMIQALAKHIELEFESRATQEVDLTFGGAHEETAISHDLGTVPRYCYVIQSDRDAVVYQGGTAWTSTVVYVKCNATNAAVTLRIER